MYVLGQIEYSIRFYQTTVRHISEVSDLMISSGSETETSGRCCEHCIERYDPTKCLEFLDQLSKYWLLK